MKSHRMEENRCIASCMNAYRMKEALACYLVVAGMTAVIYVAILFSAYIINNPNNL